MAGVVRRRPLLTDRRGRHAVDDPDWPSFRAIGLPLGHIGDDQASGRSVGGGETVLVGGLAPSRDDGAA